MEGKGGEPETINVWELMKDLEDDERSPRAKHIPKAPLSRQKMASAMASTKLPSDSFTLEPPDVTELPPWLSSFHAHSGLGRSAANHTDSLIGESSVYGTARSRGGSVAAGLGSHTPELFGDKLSVLPHDTLAEHLQRSLSFEASPKKEIKGPKDGFDARQGKALKMVDTSSLSSSWLMNEDDSALSFSSPSFSAAINFRKWFRDDNRTSKRQQDSKGASKASGNEAQLPPQQLGPPLSRVTAKISGSSSQAGTGFSNMRNYAYQDGGVHPFSSNRDAGFSTPPIGQNKVSQLGSGARRHRHSFTSGNRDPQFTEDRSHVFVNRPSSWELEKVVLDPKLKVVFYSSNSQTDVHAYEDSNAVRAILISLLGASFDEKSVSQHPEYEEELKGALNTPTALIPTVYVRGRFIAGVDNIMQLYKKGVLGSMLLETVAHGLKPNAPCICRGGKFLICPVCKGKRRLTRQGEDSVFCRHCSGTGLIKCPHCLNL